MRSLDVQVENMCCLSCIRILDSECLCIDSMCTPLMHTLPQTTWKCHEIADGGPTEAHSSLATIHLHGGGFPQSFPCQEGPWHWESSGMHLYLSHLQSYPYWRCWIFGVRCLHPSPAALYQHPWRCQRCGVTMVPISPVVKGKLKMPSKTWTTTSLKDPCMRKMSNGIASHLWSGISIPTKYHMSRVWRQLIRSVHSTMKVILGHPHTFVTRETLRTIFAETAGILNSWPLCPSSDDTNVWDRITPSHLLQQRQGLYCQEISKTGTCILLSNHFWAKRLREYLLPLL